MCANRHITRTRKGANIKVNHPIRQTFRTHNTTHAHTVALHTLTAHIPAHNQAKCFSHTNQSICSNSKTQYFLSQVVPNLMMIQNHLKEIFANKVIMSYYYLFDFKKYSNKCKNILMCVCRCVLLFVLFACSNEDIFFEFLGQWSAGQRHYIT